MSSRIVFAFFCVSVAAACEGGQPPIDDDVCADDAECAAGFHCDDGACVEDVVDECPAGSVGCPCDAGVCTGVGALLTCVEDVCVVAVDDSEVPGVPSSECFSPCTDNLIQSSDGTRLCSPEGLMPGCLGATSCVAGTCVADDDPAPARRACERASDCPLHQTCVAGTCASNCDTDDDCAVAGATCISHVCRVFCSTDGSGAACDNGFVCVSNDGDSGTCQPPPPPPQDPPPPVPVGAPFTVDKSNLTFTNTNTTATFTITNPGATTQSITVKKLEHKEFEAAGIRTETQNPLFWLKMAEFGEAAEAVSSLSFDVLPNSSTTIELSDAFNQTIDKWQGTLEIDGPGSALATVYLDYSTTPDGQWAGSVHYFINFDGDDDAIAAWRDAVRAHDTDPDAVNATQNAMLVKWNDFRLNPLFTLEEWNAVVGATVSEAFNYKIVKRGCLDKTSNRNALCYPWVDPNDDTASDGLAVYTDATNRRVPTGAVELPFVMRVERDSGDATGRQFKGRIESPDALQYPGLPPLALSFRADPATCADGDGDTARCTVEVDSFDSTIVVGGRFNALGDDCGDPAFAKQQVPWLVPDFVVGSVVDGDRRVVEECREKRFPFDPTTNALAAQLNASLAGANPIADGRQRVRTIELLDGVMVNQSRLLLFVKESFSANLEVGDGAADFAAYGYVELTRVGSTIPADGYTPGVAPTLTPEPSGKLDLRCDDELIETVLGAGGDPEGDSSDADVLASVLLTGAPRDDVGVVLAGPDRDRVHWLCHETGRFDGGNFGDGVAEECPLGSGITFFYFDPDDAGDAIALVKNAACQGDGLTPCLDEECPAALRGTCGSQLEFLQRNFSASELVVNLPYVCDDGSGAADTEAAICSDDRLDLRADKIFFEPAGGVARQVPLTTSVDDAFRYKTRFRSRTGQTLGFVPAVCELGSDALPYCYDPAVIDDVRARTDCLLHLYTADKLGDPGTIDAVETYLKKSFSFSQANGQTFDGFERLYSELLIMLGDEDLTAAVGSRFDLAGSAIGTFEGDKFEPNGIVLSGGAGNQMRLLYRAHQYYQLVLDRFWQMSPPLWQNLTPDSQRNVITLESLSTTFNRLILASTKKTQAANEIAKQYQAFNRPDLARHVIERSFTEAYLESVALSQFMRRAQSVVDLNEVDAARRELEQAKLQYNQSLREMREAYQAITDEVTFFGDAPDFVPFPAPGRFDVPSPRLLLDRAFESLAIAKERDERALGSNRAFDVDATQFQAELSRVSNDFENQLADLCGTFEANGQVLPAIAKYADDNAALAVLGDPCGLVGNGAIFDAMANIESAKLALRGEIADIRAVYQRVDNEQARADAECDGRVAIADIRFAAAGQTLTIKSQIQELDFAIADWERELSELDRTAGVFSAWGGVAQQLQTTVNGCNLSGVFTCAAQTIAGGVATLALTGAAATQSVALDTQFKANADIRSKQQLVNQKELQIDGIARDADYAAAVGECCLARDGDGDCARPGPLMVNSQARVDDLLVDLLRANADALRADVEVQRAIGNLANLRNRATRLEAQQAETEQHIINVAAARNDPNVRIFANADVLDADRAFNLARIDAFRATRNFEFYTAQSYAEKNDLFLVRLAGRGENNLEDYLLDLQREFNDFEQTFGRADLRVDVVSLRDDIFKIDRALAPAQRNALFVAELQKTQYLDDRGYIRVPFATSIRQTSPVTAIHKVRFVESEISGRDTGDLEARLYLTSRGTSTVRALDGSLSFQRIPPITAVLNPFLNGNKFFTPEVYESDRLKDRPFVNSLWEVTLNLRDEEANADIDLNSLTDIRIFFFYEDFAQL